MFELVQAEYCSTDLEITSTKVRTISQNIVVPRQCFKFYVIHIVLVNTLLCLILP